VDRSTKEALGFQVRQHERRPTGHAHNRLARSRRPSPFWSCAGLLPAGGWSAWAAEPVSSSIGAFKGYRRVGGPSPSASALSCRAWEHRGQPVSRDPPRGPGVQAAVRASARTEGWECGRYFRWDDKDKGASLFRRLGHSDDMVQQLLAKSVSFPTPRESVWRGKVCNHGNRSGQPTSPRTPG